MENRNIDTVRGDMLPISLDLVDINDNSISFKIGDVLRFKIFDKKDVQNVILQKDFVVETETKEFYIEIPAEDMEIGELTTKPVEYWYEIKLNPDTPKRTTIVGSDKVLGTPIITLLVAGGNK